MKTCLVVDDSSVVRKVARRILEDIGYQVAEAADGVEALAACKEAMPEVILLDWNMPVMTGFEFLGDAAPRARRRSAQGGVLHRRKRPRPHHARRSTSAPTSTS